MSILSPSAKTDSSNSKDKIHEVSTDIANEFKGFVSDMESLIKETASLTGDELAQAKIKMNQRINVAKQRVNSASSSMVDQARKTATVTNEFVHEKPWSIIGAGAIVSFVLGMVIGHCKDASTK